MAQLIERDTRTLRVGGDERLARAELRRQIGRLELELGGLVAEGFGRVAVDASVPAAAPAGRPLDLGELEAVRDALAERIGAAQRQLHEQDEREARNRELLERMIASPADHKWLQISRDDIGAPGCGHWHSLPRLGPLGMLMGWWRVRVSSGCPLAGRLAAVDPGSRKKLQATPAGRRAPARPLGLLPAG